MVSKEKWTYSTKMCSLQPCSCMNFLGLGRVEDWNSKCDERIWLRRERRELNEPRTTERRPRGG